MDLIAVDIKIDNDIVQKTTKCRENFSCLSGKTPLCKVECCIENKVLFIKCISNEPCDYRVSFGHSYVCVCPVRIELYNRYKI